MTFRKIEEWTGNAVCVVGKESLALLWLGDLGVSRSHCIHVMECRNHIISFDVPQFSCFEFLISSTKACSKTPSAVDNGLLSLCVPFQKHAGNMSCSLLSAPPT